MNPFDLDATGLLVWGVVAHLIADWLLQSDWMAANKASLRHPAGYVHAGIHGLALALVFGWASLLLAVAHLLIDTRVPVAWLSRIVRQTPPRGPHFAHRRGDGFDIQPEPRGRAGVLVDVGLLVRMNVDQVWHVACIAIAALLVSAA